LQSTTNSLNSIVGAIRVECKIDVILSF